MPLLEQRHGRLLEEPTGIEGKGEKIKLKKGIKHRETNKHRSDSSGKAV